MNEYKPNSHKYHAEKKEETSSSEKRVSKVVSGTVQVNKKKGVGSLAKTFLAEDLADVGTYLWTERIVPTIKRTIVNMATDAVNMIFLGKNAPSSSSNGSPSGSKVSYRSYYDDPKRNEIPTATNRFDYGQVEFRNRGDAEAVRVEMGHILHRWGYVRVSDMFDLAGLVPPVSSFKYGWTDISRAVVKLSGDKYIIELPKAMPID